MSRAHCDAAHVRVGAIAAAASAAAAALASREPNRGEACRHKPRVRSYGVVAGGGLLRF